MQARPVCEPDIRGQNRIFLEVRRIDRVALLQPVAVGEKDQERGARNVQLLIQVCGYVHRNAVRKSIKKGNLRFRI